MYACCAPGADSASSQACMQVLQVDKASTKALFRRGRARRRLGQVDAACADLQEAERLSPDDAAIKRELAALSRCGKQGL